MSYQPSSPRGRSRGGPQMTRGGRGRGSWSTPYRTGPAEPEISIMDGLGAYVADVAFNNDSIAHPTAAVENVVPIASYSWLDERTPTIAVPCKSFRIMQ